MRSSNSRPADRRLYRCALPACRSPSASAGSECPDRRGRAVPRRRPSVTVLGTKQKRRAFSAARCAAAPTRTWAGSSTCSSTAPARCAPPSSISAAFSASAAARSRSIGTRCTSFPQADKRDAVTLDLTRDQVKAAPGIQGRASRSSSSARLGSSIPAECTMRSLLCAAEPLTASATVTDARGEDHCRRRAAPHRGCRIPRAAACAGSTGSSSLSPTCRPASARSSRSI